MRLRYLLSRSVLIAASVLAISLVIATNFSAEEPSSDISKIPQQAELAAEGEIDLVSALQGKVHVEPLGQNDKVQDKIMGNKAKSGVALIDQAEVTKTAVSDGGSSLEAALRHITSMSFMRSSTTGSISTVAVVMIVSLLVCTCVGALSIAYPHKFPFWGQGRYTLSDDEVMAPVLEKRQLMLERKAGLPGSENFGPAGGQNLLTPLSPFDVSPKDHIERAMETALISSGSLPPVAAQETHLPPPLCPTLVMPVCEARFGVPMFELAELHGEGEVTIVGLSGNPLLRGVVRMIGNARTLEISMPEQHSAPKATITPSMMELAGNHLQGKRALEIRGMRGRFYGTLEMQNSGACYVMKDGQAVLTIDGDSDNLELSITSGVGLELASVRCSAEPFGGVDHVEVRVEAGVDTVLVLAVVLAVLLLSPDLGPKDF